MGGEGSGRVAAAQWVPAEGTDPWDRQPHEGQQAWAAFVAYRDIEQDRTLVKAVDALGKKPTYLSTLEDWSRHKGWRIRVDAWDAHKDKVSREAALEAKRVAATEMVNRHLQLSTHMQRLVSVELMRWIHKLGANDQDPDLRKRPTLTPMQLQSLLNDAVKLERLNRDQPGELSEISLKGLNKETADWIRTEVLGVKPKT